MYSKVRQIDHVIICVQPENVHTAAKAVAKLLDIEFEGPFEPEGRGVCVYIDWNAGLEIAAPIDPLVAVEQTRFLRERGEGVFSIVFGFADRDAALTRAEDMGYKVVRRFDFGSLFPAWEGRFESSLESVLEPVYGVRWNFGQIVHVGEAPTG